VMATIGDQETSSLYLNFANVRCYAQLACSVVDDVIPRDLISNT